MKGVLKELQKFIGEEENVWHLGAEGPVSNYPMGKA